MAAPYANDLKKMNKQDVIDALAEIRYPYEVAVYGSKNSGNFGCIIRTGNSFLCRKYYSVDIPWFYEKAAMTALKYEKHLIDNISLNEFLERTKGRNIVAFERRDNLECHSINSFEYPENPILLFGNEDSGIPDALLNVASHIVTIPMHGLIWDLNIGVAAGIAMHDFVKKYTLKNHNGKSA